jgi:hypothetical protein
MTRVLLRVEEHFFRLTLVGLAGRTISSLDHLQVITLSCLDETTTSAEGREEYMCGATKLGWVFSQAELTAK